MIRHIVFFTARDRKDLDAIVEGLELLGTIPHSLHFEVVQNSKVDQIGNDVDVVVYGEFADEAALTAYKAHPTYAEATKRVRPLRELRLAADIRSGRPLALMMFDIDFFKKLNDGYGHLAGDLALKQLSQVVQKALRTEDIFARYGGEEFALVLPEIPKQHGAKLAEKIRRLIEAEPFIFDNISIPVTLSMGVADLSEYLVTQRGVVDPNDINPFAFIKLADDRLYEAKKSGRNRVCY
mgnify:CR=1 FL=1